MIPGALQPQVPCFNFRRAALNPEPIDPTTLNPKLLNCLPRPTAEESRSKVRGDVGRFETQAQTQNRKP